jgi:hypothetical protein
MLETYIEEAERYLKLSEEQRTELQKRLALVREIQRKKREADDKFAKEAYDAETALSDKIEECFNE